MRTLTVLVKSGPRVKEVQYAHTGNSGLSVNFFDDFIFELTCAARSVRPKYLQDTYRGVAVSSSKEPSSSSGVEGPSGAQGARPSVRLAGIRKLASPYAASYTSY